MEQQVDYKSERETYVNIIRHSLGKLPHIGMDYFARRIQCLCENTVPKGERDKFKLGIKQDRKACGVYILNNMSFVPNRELGVLAGEMMRRIEDYEAFNLYAKEDWKEGGW